MTDLIPLGVVLVALASIGVCLSVCKYIRQMRRLNERERKIAGEAATRIQEYASTSWVPTLVCTIDETGGHRIDWANAAFLEHYGVTLDQLQSGGMPATFVADSTSRFPSGEVGCARYVSTGGDVQVSSSVYAFEKAHQIS